MIVLSIKRFIILSTTHGLKAWNLKYFFFCIFQLYLFLSDSILLLFLSVQLV